MKNKSKNLDVDFIGGEKPITIEEEKAISEFIKELKLNGEQKLNPKSRTLNSRKSIA